MFCCVKENISENNSKYKRYWNSSCCGRHKKRASDNIGAKHTKNSFPSTRQERYPLVEGKKTFMCSTDSDSAYTKQG